MLSVNNMLNSQDIYHHQQAKRPAVLDIANLLCSNTPSATTSPTCSTSSISSLSSSTSSISHITESPSLSPSYTSSPGSVSSYTSYPFPPQPYIWEDMKKQTDIINHTPMSCAASYDDEHDELILDDDEDDDLHPIKAKRRRANAKQLEVLNRVFERTFFPSTQMRAELGRQLGMSPRTVQIWFQNRRQAMRTKERHRLIKLRNESK